MKSWRVSAPRRRPHPQARRQHRDDGPDGGHGEDAEALDRADRVAEAEPHGEDQRDRDGAGGDAGAVPADVDVFFVADEGEDDEEQVGGMRM